MKVKDVMTSPVVSVEPDASIWQAARIMLQRHISGLQRTARDRQAWFSRRHCERRRFLALR